MLAIAKESHREELRRLLQDGFVDVDHAIQSGRLTLLSAEAACESICVDGEPVWDRFIVQVGGRIRELAARQGGKPVRVWGEVVDVFRSSGRGRAAIRLEEMFNELSRTENFSRLCSYDLRHFALSPGDIAIVESLHGRAYDSEAFVDESPASAQGTEELQATIRELLAIEEELREQSRVNTNLVRIATALTSELDLDRLVQKVTDEATALCRAQFGAFFHNVLDDKGQSYSLYSLSGASKGAFAKLPMPRNTEVFRSTFDGTEIVRSDDITQDPRFGKNPPYHGMPPGHLAVRSYLAVPVKSRRGQTLGGLFFGHSKAGVFTAADERLAVSVAGQAAVAIDNASLFRAARRAESAAHAERMMFEQLFNQSPAIIAILRGPDLVYDFVNDTALALVHRKDVIGKPLREATRDIKPERFQQIEEVYRTGQRWSGEAIPLVRAWEASQPPTERFFNVSFEPFRRPDGVVDAVMVFGFDVTEQVLSARNLEALAKELDLANRMKDEFLATVSHELRTPLNAILGWVRMLRGGNLPTAKWDRALETIERNANAQTQLIEDLLDVSRIISGKLRLEVADVDIVSVIENAIDAVRPAADARCIELHQTLDPVGSIFGDKDRLQQVVWNLLANAVKFTPKGGSVTVELHRVDGTVEIRVADTGQGIEADFVDKVFERFRQVDATPARKQGGLGLGLAIVRHLVELHGGGVRAESKGLGAGATFTVVLPVAPLRSPTTEHPPALRVRPTGGFACPPELQGVRIVVVVDEPDARELLAEILGRCEAEVFTAATSETALRMVRELHPDIVISDIGMPEEDGYVFIRRLRALSRDEGGKTPAIALTAYARVEDRTKALVAGFNMHVPKPVEPTELLAVLRGLVAMFAGE